MFSSARCFWPAPGYFSSFMPDEGAAALLLSLLLFSVAAPPPAEDGALCICAPPASWPVPCALARPVPAISASAATEIKNRFFILLSSLLFALPAPTTAAVLSSSGTTTVPAALFFAREEEQNKRAGCIQPALACKCLFW